MATKQETFDLVVAHARRQGRKSQELDSDGEPYCRYRSTEGHKCFAGSLIPDDRYDIGLEGQIATYHPVASILRDCGHDPTLAKELQIVHDAYEVYEWEQRLAAVARMFGLTYTPPA